MSPILRLEQIVQCETATGGKPLHYYIESPESWDLFWVSVKLIESSSTSVKEIKRIKLNE